MVRACGRFSYFRSTQTKLYNSDLLSEPQCDLLLCCVILAVFCLGVGSVLLVSSSMFSRFVFCVCRMSALEAKKAKIIAQLAEAEDAKKIAIERQKKDEKIERAKPKCAHCHRERATTYQVCLVSFANAHTL